MNEVWIQDRQVGPGHPCLIAAEIGLNHNGDLDLARRTIDSAAAAGVDAVKFQNYHTEDFLSDRTLTYEYVSQGRRVEESQFDMFKRCELPDEWLVTLREHCDQCGVMFFSTPTSESGIQELVRAGSVMLKNGSDYLVQLPLIRAMASTGLPTVLSTGMATLAEVDDAVRAFRDAGGSDLILLHCTSAYPTEPRDVHLRKIPSLAAAFDCPVGLSDHTATNVAAVGAVALGACFLEKHFTLDHYLPGPDHWFSADPASMRDFVDAVRTLEASLGQSVIGPAESERDNRVGYRLSCVAERNLHAGHRLSDKEIAFRRPGSGLPPVATQWISGQVLRRDVAAGHVFHVTDFQ